MDKLKLYIQGDEMENKKFTISVTLYELMVILEALTTYSSQDHTRFIPPKDAGIVADKISKIMLNKE